MEKEMKKKKKKNCFDFSCFLSAFETDAKHSDKLNFSSFGHLFAKWPIAKEVIPLIETKVNFKTSNWLQNFARDIIAVSSIYSHHLLFKKKKKNDENQLE